MTEYVRHALKIQPTNDELARQGFMQGMRTYVMQTMAMGMQTVYERKVEPDFEKRNSRKPKDGHEVHQALINEAQFKFYSSLRCNAQEMTYRSVLPTIERNFESISRKAEELTQPMGKAKGTLHTDPSLQVPSYVTDVDVHHMAGNYDTEYVENDLIQGAVYDNGTSVFSMGLFGDEMDDIGTTLAQFINAKYPNFEPKRILDLGCTVGHNTVPWARTFPEAEVHGIDVCAPLVRYAHARAQALGETVHFHQQNAERMDFEAGSFDMIFSSMFLHELPVKSIRNVFKQAHRLLKPGGLMLHMELPGNEMLAPYDGFYIDWSAYYNKEPFMKAFRDMNAKELCTSTGFEPDNYFHYIVPSLRCYGEQAVLQSVDNQTGQGYEKAGRFADQVEWFCFGAWK